jgi:DNA mismatch endonuclease (patch repair protein)
MSIIRSHGNKSTELRLIELFRKHQITGWRRKQNLTGRPDFIFRSARLALFVDGCFWHGCPKHATWPKQNKAFWREKILRNRARDRQVTRELRAAGWKVLRIWEHSLKMPGPVIARIHRALARSIFPVSDS